MLESWREVKEYILNVIEHEWGSEFDVMKEAGLTRDSYYKIFSPERLDRPMRKATVYGLAKALDFPVRYRKGIPQFTVLEQNEAGEYVTLKSFARKALKYAIRVAGSIDELSQITLIPKETLTEILSESNDDSDVRIDYFYKIGAALNRELNVDYTGELTLYHPDTNKFDEDSIDILDEGLNQLLTKKENRTKHNISDIEAEVLVRIYQKISTQATIDRWTSLLYSLRGLEKAEEPSS